MSAGAPALTTPRADLGGSVAPLVGIVDYGMGNRRSVEKALDHVGARTVRSSDPAELRSAAGLVVPGVGAFPEAMRRLANLGLDALIRERHEADTPILGICLGMQVAFERSTELGGATGLALLPGQVRELRAPDRKLPHIGWNPVTWRAASPIIADVPDQSAFYHVHTFVCETTDNVIGTTDYGETFPTAVARGSFFGVQFHPEKSSTHGLRLLANFVTVVARRT